MKQKLMKIILKNSNWMSSLKTGILHTGTAVTKVDMLEYVYSQK